MGTKNQIEEQLRSFKVALSQAFGLRADQTTTQVSAGPDAVTFRVVPSSNEEWKALQDGPLAAELLQYESGQFVSATFREPSWTREQAQAVEEYLDQFPSFGTLPRDVRKALRDEFRADRP
jgi:hypothetical protein